MPLDRVKNKATAIPGGGGGGCWLGGPATASTQNYQTGSATAFGAAGNASEQSGTSIFDPVLCEIAYRWFSPVGGLILDPFAGGSVRGIVASKLGRQYIGHELRQEQVDANRIRALDSYLFGKGKVIGVGMQPVHQPDGDGVLAHIRLELDAVAQQAIHLAVAVVQGHTGSSRGRDAQR